MGQFLGEVRMFATNIIPPGWMHCDGTLLQIGKNPQLFAFIGTTYGGDGRQTFGIPDLRDLAALMSGQGPGLQYYHIGEKGGAETVTLTKDQLPLHTHDVFAQPQGNQPYPTGNDWADPVVDRQPQNFYATQLGSSISMNVQAITSTGGGGAHNNLMPYTTVIFCIAIEGWPPSRN